MALALDWRKQAFRKFLSRKENNLLFRRLRKVLTRHDKRPLNPDSLNPACALHYQGALDIINATVPHAKGTGGRPATFYEPGPDAPKAAILGWSPATKAEKPRTRDRRHLTECARAEPFKAQILGVPHSFAVAVEREPPLPGSNLSGVARRQAAARQILKRTKTNHVDHHATAVAFAILNVGQRLCVPMPKTQMRLEGNYSAPPVPMLAYAREVLCVLNYSGLSLQSVQWRWPAPFRMARLQLEAIENDV